jgi:predicted nucleic acid-binding protein
VNRLWVDANVILRFVTKEPPKIAARAAQLMAQAEAGDVSLYIAPLVLAEIVWVLRSFYQYTMTEEQLAELVTRDCLIGVTMPRAPRERGHRHG